VVAAIIQANPDLAGMESHVGQQLVHFYSSGQLSPVSWANLSAAGRLGMHRLLLQDVMRRLEGEES